MIFSPFVKTKITFIHSSTTKQLQFEDDNNNDDDDDDDHENVNNTNSTQSDGLFLLLAQFFAFF
jgi:hypothetical protein